MSDFTREKVIQALQDTIDKHEQWYIDNTVLSCPLCRYSGNTTNDDMICDECPWMLFTGGVCYDKSEEDAIFRYTSIDEDYSEDEIQLIHDQSIQRLENWMIRVIDGELDNHFHTINQKEG